MKHEFSGLYFISLEELAFSILHISREQTITPLVLFVFMVELEPLYHLWSFSPQLNNSGVRQYICGTLSEIRMVDFT